MRRPVAFLRYNAIDAPRLHQTRSGVVSFSSLSAFRARSRLDISHRSPTRGEIWTAPSTRRSSPSLIHEESRTSTSRPRRTWSRPIRSSTRRRTCSSITSASSSGSTPSCMNIKLEVGRRRCRRSSRRATSQPPKISRANRRLTILWMRRRTTSPSMVAFLARRTRRLPQKTRRSWDGAGAEVNRSCASPEIGPARTMRRRRPPSSRSLPTP